MRFAYLIAFLPLCLVPSNLFAQTGPLSQASQSAEPVDLAVVTAIREEGFNHSMLMNNLSYLTEVIGPRLTASPQMRQAVVYTVEMFKSWGLENVHAEPFEFGRGWTFSRSVVNMITPHATPLLALPQAWSPGTAGPVRGEVIKAVIKSENDFAQYKGKLKGKIVFMEERWSLSSNANDKISRFTDEELKQLGTYEIPDGRDPEWKDLYLAQRRLGKPMLAFLASEGALATVDASSRDGGLIRVMGYTYLADETPAIPRLVMMSEQYNHILRLVDSGRPVTLEVDVTAQFHDEDTKGYNVIAEIPGGAKASEIVMAGAHYDSWHAGAGASDNGAGVAVVMEAMRILKQIGVKPKRTIRVALWAGEEQGLMGSTAYINTHFATRPEPKDPWQKRLPSDLRELTWPIRVKPEHRKLSVYFNMDNGSGKIRGIYGENNAATQPVFAAWFKPFNDLGAGAETLRGTGGTDHLAFDSVGLPAFQFIQDKLDYMARLHHTNIDTLGHVKPDDLKQAAVILASFLYNAAMRDEMMPRKPMPRPVSAP